MNEKHQSCPGCGIHVDSSANICSNCGEDLTVKASAPAAHDASHAHAAGPVPAATANTHGDSARKYCTECGAATNPGQKFCGSCGAALQGDRGGTARSATQQRGHATKSMAKQRSTPAKAATADSAGIQLNTTSWVIILVSAVLLTAVIILSLRDEPAAQSAPPADASTQGPATPDLVELESLRSAAESNPSNAAAQLRYANALHDARMVDQAISRYKLYLETHPDDTDARVDLGICYFEKQEYDAAIEEMETAVAGNPTHQLGHFNLGIVNLNAGNSDAAKRWFEKARDIAPATQTGKNAVAILNEHFPAR